MIDTPVKAPTVGETYTFTGWDKPLTNIVMDTVITAVFAASVRYYIVRFWYDEGIASGAEWGDVLYERITNCTQFVCFLTKDAVQSAHVKNEVHIASKYGRRILPVFLDDVELRGALELSLDRQQSLVSTHYEETEFYQRLCAVLDPQAIEKIVTSAGTAQEELDKRYRLHKKIGGGFSGTVYLSENLRTGGNVIVKHGTVDSSYTGDAIRQSYMAECMALSQQISSFSPIVFDLIADEHNIFLAETVAPGISINKLSGLSDHDVAQIILKAAKILKSFHERGLIHCDIKPEHIFCNDPAQKYPLFHPGFRTSAPP